MADSVSEVIESFARGDIVVVTDDDDREGEGDLIVAAAHCDAAKMAFIIRHTSGIVCAPILASDARRLRLDPMVANNDSMHTTAFTVSIDYKPGGTTGISAEERSACCRALTNPNAGWDDFARPGHIFPLIAQEGGVLLRTGHTEAAIDLCRLAGLPPVGVISELMNEDGTVTKGQQVLDFAERHQLKRVTIADLIAYRQAREKLVERVATFTTNTPIGPLTSHAYRTPFEEIYHVAYTYGSIAGGEDILTRFHKPDLFRDFFDASYAVSALRAIERNGSGVFVYLRDGTAGVPISPLLKQSASEADRHRQWRDVGIGAQILRDLNVNSIRHLTSSTTEYTGLRGFGIRINETVPMEREPAGA